MSDDEDETQCPLCVEELDLSDKNFLPCPCGYRVCMWCWHHIRENLNGLCPACRTPYNADPHAFSAVDRQEIIKKNRERKQKERHEKKVCDRPVNLSIQSHSKPVSSSVSDRRHLHNYRVVQRNLVYVIGVPTNLANEDLLRKPEYFGQYGKIGKVVIHRNLSSSHATASAYVTFVYKDDARASIQSLDGFWLEGHVLRASFGTTKYCNNFIRGIPCNNPECVYLHDLGDDDDRFTKEEIQAGHSKLAQIPGKDQTIVTGNGGPSGTGKRPIGDSVLPPPVFIQDNATLQSLGQRNSSKALQWPASEMPVAGSTDVVITNNSVEVKAVHHIVSDSARKSSTEDSAICAGSSSAVAISCSNETQMEETKISESVVASESSRTCVELEAVHSPPLSATYGNSVEFVVKDKNCVLSVSNNCVADGGTMESSLTGINLGADHSVNRKSKVSVRDATEQILSSNGITVNAVFPVPLSSFTVSVWAPIMNSTNNDLSENPYRLFRLPFSELLDLTLPPVDAVCISPWPRPLSYYSQKLLSTTQEPLLNVTVGPQARNSNDNVQQNGVTSMKLEQFVGESGRRSKVTSSVQPPASQEKTSTSLSSISALRQLFPTVNLSVGSPAGGASS